MPREVRPSMIHEFYCQQLQLSDQDATRIRPCWIPGLAPFEPSRTFGSRIHAIHISSSDNAGNTVIIWQGKKLTTKGGAETITITDGAGGSDTIVRSGTPGSFITDGWRVGDRFVIVNPTSVNNEVSAILTGVTATVLTFATAVVGTGEVFATGTTLYRIGSRMKKTLALGSGYNTDIAGVSGLDANTLEPDLDVSPNRYKILGRDDAYFASVGTTLGSLENVDIFVDGGDY